MAIEIDPDAIHGFLRSFSDMRPITPHGGGQGDQIPHSPYPESDDGLYVDNSTESGYTIYGTDWSYDQSADTVGTAPPYGANSSDGQDGDGYDHESDQEPHQGPDLEPDQPESRLPCEFRYLAGCPKWFKFRDGRSWIDHIERDHLEHNYPSRSVCWFCDIKFKCTDKNSQARKKKFEERLTHIAEHIWAEKKTEDDTRLDFYFLKHLYKHKLIDEEIYEHAIRYSKLSKLEGRPTFASIDWIPPKRALRRERGQMQEDDLGKQDRQRRKIWRDPPVNSTAIFHGSGHHAKGRKAGQAVQLTNYHSRNHTETEQKPYRFRGEYQKPQKHRSRQRPSSSSENPLSRRGRSNPYDVVEKPQAFSNASEGNSAKSIGQHTLAEVPCILRPPREAPLLQDSGCTADITGNHRVRRAGPRLSHVVPDCGSTLSRRGAASNEVTLDCLPLEVHAAIFDNLHVIDSTSLGLTNKRFYAIHRGIHGTVPLSTRRGGLNHVEKAWEMAASLTPGKEVFGIPISPVLGPIPVISSLMSAVHLGQSHRATSQFIQPYDVQFFCPKCGFRQCELHKHISEWMGSHSEYCAIREKFVSPAEKSSAAALCSGFALGGKLYCARHRIRDCKLLDDVDSQQTPGSSDPNPRQCHQSQPPDSDTQSQHSSASPSQMDGSTEERDSSSSSENNEGCYTVSHSRRAMIIERVMVSFKAWLNSRLSVLTYHYHGTSAAGQQSSSHSCAPGGNHENETRPQKRRPGGEGQDDSSGEPADENDDDGKGGEQARKKTRLDWQQKRKFACPFYKHDRRAYQSWRVCSGPGWDSLHRVKEHIYRKHTVPKYRCSRCFLDLKNSASFANHQRLDIQCEIQEYVSQEGFIDDGQEKALRARPSRRTESEKSEHDKWIGIYQIIFPDDEKVPSPYYDDEDPYEGKTGAEQFADFIRLELPRLVRRELESAFDGQLEDTLRSRIMDRMGDVPAELYRQFQRRSEVDPHDVDIAATHNYLVDEVALEDSVDPVFHQWIQSLDFPGFDFDISDLPPAPDPAG